VIYLIKLYKVVRLFQDNSMVDTSKSQCVRGTRQLSLANLVHANWVPPIRSPPTGPGHYQASM